MEKFTVETKKKVMQPKPTVILTVLTFYCNDISNIPTRERVGNVIVIRQGNYVRVRYRSPAGAREIVEVLRKKRCRLVRVDVYCRYSKSLF